MEKLKFKTQKPRLLTLKPTINTKTFEIDKKKKKKD